MRSVSSKEVVLRDVIQRVVLVCLILLAISYPLIEFLDRWDVPGATSDSELQVIALLTLLGMLFLLARMLIRLAGCLLLCLIRYLRPDGTSGSGVFAFIPTTVSPPIPLRI